MSLAAKLLRCSSLLKSQKLDVLKGFNIARRSSSVKQWNYLWKPGPYPRTQEERIAAAKKYNLIPEDYEPYPEEEGHGDYPKLQPFSPVARDPFEPYDYIDLRRNYGEPLHHDFEFYAEDKCDPDDEYYQNWGKYFFRLVLTVGIFVTIMVASDKCIDWSPKAAPKQFPYQGIKHYSFEPAEE